MAYTFDRADNSIVINGIEKGISPSPDLGIADIKCANISTLTGEAMVNFARSQQNEKYSASTSGTITATNGVTLLSYVFTVNPTNITFLQPGSWITISSSTITGLANGNYFIDFASNLSTQITLSSIYDNSGINSITPSSNGTATFTFLQNTSSTGGIMTKPVASATEYYTDSNKITQNRYYIMDTEGHVWVNDTAVTNNGSNYWAQIDTVTARQVVYGGGTTEQATGLAVYNGFLIMFIGELTCYKLTAMLGVNPHTPAQTGWATSGNGGFGVYGATPTGTLNSYRGSTIPHFCYNSKSGALYWTDNSFVGSLVATAIGTDKLSPNVFAYGQVTASSSAGLLLTVTDYIAGSIPAVGMPLTFWTTGTYPGGISADTIYYVISATLGGSGALAFKVSTTRGGSAVAFSGAGTGNLYYNTLDLNNNSTFIFSPQALTLAQQSDTAQCLTEIGNQILVGCASNTLYFWDGVNVTANGFLYLPEANTVNMITANNMAYVFTGSRGNIYITNGNTSSLVVTVPDYITGVPDPYFSWGGAMYAKGRIWFSIQDQNASKTGNCGGIWSFVPTQNLFIGQDTGLALRLEHQNSYGTYNGMANLLINEINQNAQGVQYFSAWTSSITSPQYGIDQSTTTPYTGGQTIIETDLVPVGNFLDKGNFTSIVTKYDAQLVSGESVQVLYRTDVTSAFTALGGPLLGIDSSVGSLGWRFETPFTNIVHMQFKIVLTSTSTNPSFVRFRELRIRK